MRDLDFSLCSSVMNRNDHLRMVIPTWKELPFKRCIIIDWSSDIPVYEGLHDLLDDRFTIIRVDGQKYYYSSVVHNFSISFVETEWTFRVDSDIFFDYHKLLNMRVEDNCFYVGGLINPLGTEGTVLAKTQWFEDTGGYDERQIHYGGEDLHCFERIKGLGCSIKRFPRSSLCHINHSDNLRTIHRDMDNLESSMKKQCELDYREWGSHSQKHNIPVYEVFTKSM